MAKDKNIVVLEGLVGNDFKYGKTSEGKEYATFSLCINSFMKELSDSTERTHMQAFIRIFVYDQKQVEYLHKVNAHRGQRASVFGRLTSHKNEFRGNTFMTVNVACRDIAIIKTKEEAFLAHKQTKEEYIKEVAQEYFDKGEIDKRVYDALMNYKVEITD